MEEDKEESELPMRFKHFKSSGTNLNAPGEDEDGDEDEDIVSNEEKVAELEDGVIENPEAVVDTLELDCLVEIGITVSVKLKQNNRNSI